MFRKSDPASPIISDRPPHGAGFSVIGTDVVITGDIRTSAVLHLEGWIEGDVECAELIQGETGRILGAIRAETVRLAGNVEGSVETRALTIEATGRLSGEVAYETLAIIEGGELNGRLVTRTAPPPAAADDEESADPALLEDRRDQAALEEGCDDAAIEEAAP